MRSYPPPESEWPEMVLLGSGLKWIREPDSGMSSGDDIYMDLVGLTAPFKWRIVKASASHDFAPLAMNLPLAILLIFIAAICAAIKADNIGITPTQTRSHP